MAGPLAPKASPTLFCSSASVIRRRLPIQGICLFIEHRAGDQRHMRRDRRRIGIEGMARQHRAVHRRPPARQAILAAEHRGRRAQLLDHFRPCAHQPVHRHVLELVDIAARQAELAHHFLRHGARGVAGFKLQERPALIDDAVKQALGARHRHQAQHFAAAAGLAENRDIAGIAAELGDVVLHPLQHRHQVQQAGIGGIFRCPPLPAG